MRSGLGEFNSELCPTIRSWPHVHHRTGLLGGTRGALELKFLPLGNPGFEGNQRAVGVDHQRLGLLVEISLRGFSKDGDRDAQDDALAATAAVLWSGDRPGIHAI